MAISRLGEPAKQQTIAGDRVYTQSRTIGESECTIHFVTDDEDHVIRYDWSGSRVGCNFYDDALGP